MLWALLHAVGWMALGWTFAHRRTVASKLQTASAHVLQMPITTAARSGALRSLVFLKSAVMGIVFLGTLGAVAGGVLATSLTILPLLTSALIPLAWLMFVTCHLLGCRAWRWGQHCDASPPVVATPTATSAAPAAPAPAHSSAAQAEPQAGTVQRDPAQLLREMGFSSGAAADAIAAAGSSLECATEWLLVQRVQGQSLQPSQLCPETAISSDFPAAPQPPPSTAVESSCEEQKEAAMLQEEGTAATQEEDREVTACVAEDVATQDKQEDETTAGTALQELLDLGFEEAPAREALAACGGQFKAAVKALVQAERGGRRG